MIMCFLMWGYTLSNDRNWDSHVIIVYFSKEIGSIYFHDKVQPTQSCVELPHRVISIMVNS